jgi:hypothetical protein
LEDLAVEEVFTPKLVEGSSTFKDEISEYKTLEESAFESENKEVERK